MNAPKISFILPAYKRRFLHEAIASILAQTYRDFELVVVDDCSPEDLKPVVDEFHDERLTYHRNSANIGGKDLVAAWNHAMEYARGEWCVIASDDDVYDPEYLREMLRLQTEYPEVDVFHCRIAAVDDDGKLLYLGRPRGEYESGMEMIYNTAVNRIELRAPDIMFRRSALQAIGGFVWSPRAWFTDIATWSRLSRDHGAVCSNRILFKWRSSRLNISSVHADAELKLEAARQFKPWVRELIESTPCHDEWDELFRQRALSGYVSATNSVTRGVIRISPFGVWLKIFVAKSSPWGMRLRMIKDRFINR